MTKRISTAVAAAALVVSAAGASFLIPSLVAAADPTASPAASTVPSATTAPSGTTAPDTSKTTADCPGGAGGAGGPGGPGLGADDVTAAANALGMSEADVTTALQGGQTLAEIAADQGVDVQKVVDAMVAAETAEIQAKVADGSMTQAEADQRIADLTAHETDEVNGVAPAGMPGGGPGGRDHHGQPPAAPSTTTPSTSTNTTSTSTSS